MVDVRANNEKYRVYKGVASILSVRVVVRLLGLPQSQCVAQLLLLRSRISTVASFTES